MQTALVDSLGEANKHFYCRATHMQRTFTVRYMYGLLSVRPAGRLSHASRYGIVTPERNKLLIGTETTLRIPYLYT